MRRYRRRGDPKKNIWNRHKYDSGADHNSAYYILHNTVLAAVVQVVSGLTFFLCRYGHHSLGDWVEYRKVNNS
jgi:hypothetical protein